MKRLFITLLLLMTACASAPKTEKEKRAFEDEIDRVSAHFIESLKKGDFDAATTNFDATMTTVVSPYKLENIWKDMEKNFGKLVEIGEREITTVASYPVTFTDVTFSKSSRRIQLTFNYHKEIAGFFIRNKKKKENSNAKIAKSPCCSSPKKGFAEMERSIENGEWSLPGTLTIPEGDGPFPAVILVHGSGPASRDEVIGATEVFKELAHGLAKKRVAVYRYDKRTLHHRNKMKALENITLEEETIEDAVKAVETLLKEKRIDGSRIFIAGHSLGGYAAPRIAERSSKVAGIAILAGSVRTIDELLIEQLEYIRSTGEFTEGDETFLEHVKETLPNLKSLTPETPREKLPLGIPFSYWDYMKKYDPLKTAAGITIPTLIVQGERDYQVTEKDFNMWKKGLEGKNNVKFILYPNMDHRLCESSGKGKVKRSEYGTYLPVSENLINDLVKWIGEVR